MPRELILLSPYTPPTQHALSLAAEDTASWLNAWAALWHPVALAGAVGPPKWASPHDHDPPIEGHIYAIPETPPPYMAGDWEDRVRKVGAAAFRASADRSATIGNMQAALEPTNTSWSAEDVRPFFGLGLAYATVETLFEAMEHERLLDREGFWADMQAAIGNSNSAMTHLRNAAAKLLTARDSLYTATIHLLDFALAGSSPAVPANGRSPLNVIVTGEALDRLAREQPDQLAAWRQRIADFADEPLLEICGGTYFDREDELLPVESQLWNLHRGLEVTKRLTGADVQTFASRRGSFHPQTPLLLQQVGLTKALFLSFTDSQLPVHKATVIQWPAADGKQIEAFTRAPLPAEDPNTYFNLAHHLHQTIMQDSAATLALLHRPEEPAAPSYDDWLAVSELAPVLGAWTTASRYLGNGVIGEYTSPANSDEFAIDALEPRCKAASNSVSSSLAGEVVAGSDQPHPPAPSPIKGEGERIQGFAPPSPIKGEGGQQPVSAFAVHQRLRRRLDAARTYAALHRALGGGRDAELQDRFASLEERIERLDVIPVAELELLEQRAVGPLVERLLGRAASNNPGLLLLNPCATARRVTVEPRRFQRDSSARRSGQSGPARWQRYAVGRRDSGIRIHLDQSRRRGERGSSTPWFFFARKNQGADAPARRPITLADSSGIRNESFEAEIDPTTGGLRSIRDSRTRENRLGQQLVYQPGSKTIVEGVEVTSAGPASVEIVSTGTLVDDHDGVLATFRQRFRAWLGRPLLELQIEMSPTKPPQGYPWHAYYGARFAWRDERATLLRGVVGHGSVTTHTRPTTPDYLELQSGSHRTLLLPGGLPFHQRHGSRMLDMILIPPGESASVFDLAICLDREQPMQTAWGFTSPVLAIPVDKGPPHTGATGWLFHLDAPNLLMTSLSAEPGDAIAVVARMLELNGTAGGAELLSA